MLRRLLSLIMAFVVLAAMGAVCAFAQNYTLSDDTKITLPDGFTLLTEDRLKQNEEVITDLGHSVSSLRSYMNDNNVLFIAVDDQNKNQAQLAAYETDFSRDVKDLAGLKAEELEQIGNQMLGRGFEIISINDWVYFKTSLDGLVGYATLQYITFKNGKLYTLSYYGSDSSLANKIAAGLVLPKQKSGTKVKTVILSVLLWVVLVIALVTMVLLALSLFADFRKSREDNDVREYIRIKRRRKL